MVDWTELRRNYLRPELPAVIALYLVLRALGWVALLRWWIVPALVVAGSVIATLGMRASGGRLVHGWNLWLRVAALVVAMTPVMYATGWGPMLTIGFVFILAEIGRDVGSAVVRPAMVCSLVAIVIGQVAVQVGFAPSFVSPPEVHGLAALAAVGLAVSFNLTSVATRKQERAEAEVRKSEERFRALVRNVSDVIMLVDRNGIIRYVSPAAEREFGRSARELVGTAALDLVDPSDDDRPYFEDLSQLGEDVVRSTEMRFRASDGRWQWYEVGATNKLADPSVRGFVMIFHNITERRRFQDELAHQAFHDVLTALPNRAGFLARLRGSLAEARSETTVAVLFLDVDRFKLVNDSLGHDVGDQLLEEIAVRLRECMRPGDIVARFGGDEFTVLVPDVDGIEDAEAVAERALDALRDPIRLGAREVFVTGSIGIAMANAESADPTALVRDADLAMYLAKERGRARYEVFDGASALGVMSRLELEADLWRAVDEEGLEVHFQPEVELATGRVVALEALVRWRHPTRGLLLPSMFIPFAEESSLILAVDRFVLREALRRASAWQAQVHGDLRIDINLSPRFLRQADAVSDVALALDRSPLPAWSVQLEITERSALDDDEQARRNLRAFRALGVHVAIDDFGVGYSSLGYLKQLPVDVLKLDRTFVDGIAADAADESVARAVIALGHALGMRVTAEGVERAEQATRLRALGCDTAQGWYFAPAEPPERVEAFLTGAEPLDTHADVVPFRARRAGSI